MLNADKTTPKFANLFALNMALTHNNSRVYSLDEIEGIAKSIGLRTKEIKLEDFLPYKILGKNVNFVMVAHLLHKDISKYPATLSKQWIKLLLNKTSFKGKIISDDFEMKALDEFSIEEKIRKTILSGISLIPICSGKEEVMLNFWETTIKIAEKESSFLSVLESLQ